MKCPKIAAFKECECKDIPMPPLNLFEGIDNMIKSATYGILKRSFELSDAPDFEMTILDTGLSEVRTIFYKKVARAEIVLTYGNPFTVQLNWL